MKRRSVVSALMAGLMLAGTLTGLTACGSSAPEAYNYNLDEYVTVGEYKGLPYVKEEASVTPEEVQAEIDSRLAASAVTVNQTEGVVEDGDTINVAYVGTIDGVEFDGGSTSSSDITIGTTSLIDGFIDGLMGQKIGDTVTLDLKFPDDYWNADVAGKDVTFVVTINSKKVTTTPELNDAFVQANSDLETVEEYRASVEQELLENKQEDLDNDVKNELWGYIISQSEVIQYPEEEMAASVDRVLEMEQQYKAQAASYGLEWADYLGLFVGTDEEGWEAIKQDYAEYLCESEMIMYAIARAEKVELSDKEYKSRIQEILESSGLTAETFQNYYGMTIEEYADANAWYGNFLLEKVMDKIMELGEQVSQEEYDEIVAAREAAAAEEDGADD